jgi:steroid delta-isomerase-like uncharacterized protein
VATATRAQAALELFEAWERRDFDAAAELVADNIAFQDHPAQRAINGRREFLDWHESWAKAATDSTASPRLLDAGDQAVILGVWRGTNDGQFGPFPATGRRVDVPFVFVANFDDQGRIAGGGAYYDYMTMLVQLGHMEPPGS